MEGTARLINALRPLDLNLTTCRSAQHKSDRGLQQLARIFRHKLQPFEYEQALRYYLPESKKATNRKRFKPKREADTSRDEIKRVVVEPPVKVDKRADEKKFRISRFNGSLLRESKPLGDQTQRQSKTMYSYFSKQGHLITENQDTIIVDRNLWLVCDGHGKNGKSASDFVSRILHESLSFLFSQENNVNVEVHDIQRVTKNIRQIFHETNQQLKNESFDVTLSGSTANILLKTKTLLISANCGDSQTIICRKGQTIILTKNHRPDAPGQRKRIQQHGGILKRTSKVSHPNAPLRVYNNSGIVPGLAIARSFGDTVAQSCGVVCTPDVNFYTRTPEDQYAIMGSDGLFEFFQPDEIITFCQNYLRQNKKFSQIAHCLVTEAANRWKTIEHDDISCIFVSLKN